MLPGHVRLPTHDAADEKNESVRWCVKMKESNQLSGLFMIGGNLLSFRRCCCMKKGILGDHQALTPPGLVCGDGPERERKGKEKETAGMMEAKRTPDATFTQLLLRLSLAAWSFFLEAEDES